MSDILNLQRDIAAICGPETGTRATGAVTMVAEAADVNIPRNTFIIPILDGQLKPSFVFRVGPGPNLDKSWTVTSEGVQVDAMSNIGGARFNLSEGTAFRLDPPSIEGIASILASSDFEGGSDKTAFGALRDVVFFEKLGAKPNVDLLRSEVVKFPAMIITWIDSTPADGTTLPNVQSSRGSRNSTVYKEMFQLTIFSSRAECDHLRREEGHYLMENLCDWLKDRTSVDGRVFSAPSGLHILRRYREDGRSQIYQRFYIYNILLTAQNTLTRRDVREWNDWNTTVIDSSLTQRPALPNQGDKIIVDDMTVEMQ
jgi:hypothetical protein